MTKKPFFIDKKNILYTIYNMGIDIKMNKDLLKFFSGTAHDLNNMLGGIVNTATYLINKVDNEEIFNLSDIKGDLNNILKFSDRSINILNNIVALTMSNKIELSKLNINDLLNEVIYFIKNNYRKVKITSRLSASLPLYLGNGNLLYEAFFNIIMNAVDATNKRGNISIESLVKDESIAISISDNGCGISDSIKNKVFTPQFSTKSTSKSRGLGLYIAKYIIERFHGDISFISKKGKNTCFNIFLPMHYKKSKEETMDFHLGVDKSDALIIDNDELTMKSNIHILKDYFDQIYNASNAQDGIMLLKDNLKTVNMILLDYYVTEKAAKDVISEIKRIKPEAKILLMSTYNVQDDIKQLFKLELHGLLQKPINPQELQLKIEKIME